MIILTCLMTVGLVFVAYLEDVEAEDSRGRARFGESEQFHWAVMMVVNLTSELHDPNARINHMCKKEERKRPSREHRYGVGQLPSEG